MENLYNYIFWYNPLESTWYAIDRDTQLDFFNGNRKKSKYYKSNQHSTLVELLTKPSVLKKFNEK
jgi:hypothetical protein